MNGMLLRPWRRLRGAIARCHYREQGQTITEYALLIGGIAVVVIIGMLFVGGKIDIQFHKADPPGPLKPPTVQCDPNYSGACIPLYPPDLDCPDLSALGIELPVSVVADDPHGLDPDDDGLGC